MPPSDAPLTRDPPAGTSSRLDQLADVLRGRGGPVEIVGALGGFAGFVLAALRQRLPRPLVIVAPDDERANEIRLGLGFFEPRTGVLDPVPAFWPLDHAPFSGMSPTRSLVLERVSTAFRLVHDLELAAVVVPARALLDRTTPARLLRDAVRIVLRGAPLDRDGFLAFLAETGYHPVPAVEDPGTFAVRGGLVDVFPPTCDQPVRVELWGDDVDTLRFFDPSSQRTTADVEEVWVGPARDILFTPATVRRARESLLALADELHVPSSRARAVTDDIESGVLAVGMEDLLPAFFERLDALFDLAPPGALWLVDDPERCEAALRARWDDVVARADRVRGAGGELAFPPDALFLPADEAISRLGSVAAGRLVPFAMEDRPAAASLRFDVADNRDVRAEIEAATREGREHVLAPLTRRVREWRERGWSVVVCAHGEAGAERLQGLLGHYGLRVARHDGDFHLGLVPALGQSPSEVDLFLGDPGQGFRSPELGLVLLDEGEIVGRRPRRRRRHAPVDPEAALASWRDLEQGDFVVHLQHGIGRYHGLTRKTVGGLDVDFLEIEYQGGNKLFVPVDKLHLVSKYVPAEGAHPALDKLGGTAWARKSGRVRKAVRDIADRLLKLYAQRELADGHAFAAPGEYYSRFEAAFPWEETPDQARAIDEVLEDMQRQRPMDRLVCGDVGFGKTEVAMRAAFLAALDGKQVAVLVPTVVLAEQHRMTFERRLEGFPVLVESLTRARTSKEARELRDRLARGEIDIVIGTHRLLSRGTAFKDLGLVIIDEEHRFGVAHKEVLKAYRADVDVLTLTATPIPRTLHMAMSGLRDISLIQTPPVDRLAIRTLVAQPSEHVIREAIGRELARGGQVFFLHNRVEDIHKQAELLQALVPQARIAVGHGQMDKGQLEDVMLRFMHGEANVLVCTTIIESGLDIPTANTILINRADRFGLAQLYQLRGRVGRSSVRAFCYLLIPAPQALAGDAARRIAAIQRFTELGSGFSIASYDLDIRGAGDVLGADQAGHINIVGYDAYMDMLRDAIAEAQDTEESRSRLRPDPELKVPVEARIPESWLPETTLRLRIYKQLAGAATVEEIYSRYRDAVDRYGRAPEPVRNLVELMAVKVEARQLGLTSVAASPAQVTLGVANDAPVDGDAVAHLVRRKGDRWRPTPDGRLVRALRRGEGDAPLAAVRESLREIANSVSETRGIVPL